MKELKSIEEKILDSALYMIGSYGSLDVPVRAIAKNAGVNVSAINYYFGSKENMMRHTKEFFIENTRGIYSILDMEEMDEEERLVQFANEIMEHTMRYTGLSVILKDANCMKEVDEISKTIVEETNKLHKKMELHLNKVVKGDKLSSKYNHIMFMSSILHPAEKGESLFTGIDIHFDKATRIEYIKFIIHNLQRTMANHMAPSS